MNVPLPPVFESIRVKPKKNLGQHFLNDEHIALKIASLPHNAGFNLPILEIGPGMGILTRHLLHLYPKVKAVEMDLESVLYLNKFFPNLTVIHGDFLKEDLEKTYNEPYTIIGNFPYNISSQILFHVIENHTFIPYICGMFQREMAWRIASPPGSKAYGIISVLVQSLYEVKYEFTVNENVFIPNPKVKSGVISLIYKPQIPPEDFTALKNVVKTAFGQRRKMLRNTLKPLIKDENLLQRDFFTKRPEELSVRDFHHLLLQIKNSE